MTTLRGTRAVRVDEVLVELATVRDPEVDEPVTSMGFVQDVEIDEGGVLVRLRLPTYFCAPNFTWLMVDDVRRAAERVAGAGRVTVELVDHFESDRIAGAVSRGETFTQAFGTEAVEDLDTLRDRFRRKTFLIRQERLCREVEARDEHTPDIASLTLGEVADLGLPAWTDYRSSREEVGIDCRHNAPFLVAADGRPVDPDRVRVHRRSAAVMAVSFEGNGHLCRSLLGQRYASTAALPLHPVTRGEVA